MLTDIQLMKVKNGVMRILHVPGNYNGGILEMAVVADYHMPKEELTETCKKIANGLKHQNETFRNVRLNLIKWVSNEQIVKEVSSLPNLQMGRAFEDYEKYLDNVDIANGEALEDESVAGREMAGNVAKTLDELLRQLKLFYARSKVIILVTDGSYKVEDEEKVWEHLNPFLKRKLLVVQEGESIAGQIGIAGLLKMPRGN